MIPPLDCIDLGFDGGTLDCTDDCQLNVEQCTYSGMALVPGGSFEMGSAEFRDANVRNVELEPFYIDLTEVTVSAYQVCVDASQCSEPDLMGVYCNWGVSGRDNHPINCVTWFQAQQYCEWAGDGHKKLPTEAEWEKAARGSDGRTYPWGNGPEPDCNYIVMDMFGFGCDNISTDEVGQRPAGASPYGVFDMAGNVWEWNSDWYADSYDPEALIDPQGPPLGTQRSLRGGGWSQSGPEYFRTAHRNSRPPTFNDAFIGFRCVREPPNHRGH